MSVKTYFSGTHRSVAPEQTYARIEPHLQAIGVTRCADVTGLDRIGVPVRCAIRPRGLSVQVTNGKGLSDIDARVSALMEALELFHAETPWKEPLRTSLRYLNGQGHEVVRPDVLSGCLSDRYFSDDFLCGWVEADELVGGTKAWIPASVVHPSPPMLFDFSSNGLASGNELIEATLHALYEIIERHAIAGICCNGVVKLSAPHCNCVDVTKFGDERLSQLVGKIHGADLKLVLLEVPNVFSVSTFWAVLLDKRPFAACTHINVGHGAHLSPSVAASRAITEAVQSRLTYIHGAREDLRETAYACDAAQSRMFPVFAQLQGDTPFEAFVDESSPSLSEDYGRVLDRITKAGFRRVYRVDLTRPDFGIPVVKVVAPGFRMNNRLF